MFKCKCGCEWFFKETVTMVDISDYVPLDKFVPTIIKSTVRCAKCNTRYAEDGKEMVF